MRAVIVQLHRYAGLSLGLVVALIGITGSVLVFDHALDERLNPVTVVSAGNEHPADLASVLDAASAAAPAGYKPYRIYIARQAGSPHVVRLQSMHGGPGPLEVSVATGTAEALAVRTWGEYPLSWIYKLHYTLLAGTVGSTVVGALGALLVFFCISGLVIWWPRNGRWRRALTMRRGRGRYCFNYDLHKLAGLYLLPVLAAVSFSGFALVFPGAVESTVATFLSTDDKPAPKATPGTAVISVDEAVAAGQHAFPGAALKRVYLPIQPDAPYTLHFNTRAESWSNLGASIAWVDPYNGTLLEARGYASAPAGTRLIRWMFPLHNGDALGLAGRWLVFVTGLLPALLFGTGVYTWWRRRIKRHHQRPSRVPS